MQEQASRGATAVRPPVADAAQRVRGGPQRAVLELLGDPRTYGLQGPRSRVELIETHFAWVFLAGGQVLKLKKPLRQWPLDYRSVASRRRGCEAELRLNRRLAPRVYRGVVPVVRTGTGRLALGGVGRAVDWVVSMRRLEARLMLDAVLRARRHAFARRRSDELARLLACFYRARAQPAPMAAARYLRRARQRLGANARVLRARRYGLEPRFVARVLGLQQQALEAIAPWLAARGRRVVEGHGDLRPEHVHLGGRIAVIDALEFDRALRLYDPWEELAFLAVECRRLGGRGFARRLLARFAHAAGEAPHPAVLRFYMSHRAAVRAKLCLWHLRAPPHGDDGHWLLRAERYLLEARRHARAALRAARSAPRSIRPGRRGAVPRRAGAPPAGS